MNPCLGATEEHKEKITLCGKVCYILNKSCSSLFSMVVRFRCGAQDSKELRLNFLAVISFSVTETKI
jgi:DNA-binding XRE family transcriptional regulator